MSQEQQAAFQAVVARFPAASGHGETAPDAHLTIGGKRVALEVVAIGGSRPGAIPAEPRLRFDRVALRLLEDVRTGLRSHVPEGQAVLLTVTAPIRLPSRTAAALEQRARSWLATRRSPAEFSDRLFGNAVRGRLVRGRSGSSGVAGFVHNPESDAVTILDAAQAFVETLARAAARTRRADTSSARWLVIVGPRVLPFVELYRSVSTQISAGDDFGKILLAFGHRRSETIVG